MAGKPVARRKFFSRAAASLSAAGVAPALLKASGANDRVVIGVVGTGGRGTWLMEEAQRQGCAIAALCDVYELRMDWAQEKVRGRKPKRFREFEKLLEEKDIDAVINATPDHWHHDVLCASVAAGKDVYTEKPFSHTIEGGTEDQMHRPSRKPPPVGRTLEKGPARHRLRRPGQDHVGPGFRHPLLGEKRSFRRATDRREEARLEEISR